MNSVLDFSRVDSDRMRATFRPTDLAGLTVDVASSFRSLVERSGLAFHVECAPLPEPVFVDSDLWEKIVLNLLSNAFKHTFAGAITVHLASREGRVELAVRDTGVGIPASELPKLFERFHRVAGARSRTHEGTGIGLALIKELVRLHGGTLEVHSKEGSGSTFTVTLPFGSQHLPPAQVMQAATTPNAGVRDAFVTESQGWVAPQTQDVAPAQTGARPRVIWADDNADMRAYVARLLAPWYDVEAHGDGATALASLRARGADVVLTDVMMPVLDGFGLLREIRQDPVLRNIPVILLSARAGEEAATTGLEAGADDYLVKPFTSRELLARIKTSLLLARSRHDAGKQEDENKRLHELDELKGQFISSAAHELRTPLTPIRAEMFMLLRGKDRFNEHDRKSIDILDRNLDRLARLVEDVLEGSRLQAGKLEIERKPADLATVAKEAVESFAAEATLKGIQLTQRIASAQVIGDERRISQVLYNLLSNALKFTPKGGTVAIEVNAKNGSAHVHVRDTGLGIPKDKQAQLFRPFSQLHEEPGLRHTGTGLGLFISKGIVELHGGTITCQSAGEGQGATFSFSIPQHATRTRHDAPPGGVAQ